LEKFSKPTQSYIVKMLSVLQVSPFTNFRPVASATCPQKEAA
jgi:hypothetical protein